MSPELKMLEKAFAAEIEDRLPFQSKAAMAKRLATQGLLQPMTVTLPGRFPVRIEGYQLTHAGRLMYCMSCDDPAKP